MSGPCVKWQDEMLDGLSSPLPREREKALEEHLAGCAACRSYFDLLRNEDWALAEMVRGAEAVIERGKERVMAAVVAGHDRTDTEYVLDLSGQACAEEALDDDRPLASRSGLVQGSVLRPTPKQWGTRWMRYGAMAAAVAIVVLGAFSYLPRHSRPGSQEKQWWLAPSAVWGEEVAAKLSTMHALVFDTRNMLVWTNGSTHVSGSWSREYRAADRGRADRYYEQTQASTRWERAEDNDLAVTDVSYEFQCYTTGREAGRGYHERDPLKWLRDTVEHFKLAERGLGTEVIDGRECVGFEVHANKYGDYPAAWIDRIWIDKTTQMPARLEEHGRPITDHPEMSSTRVREYFQYYAEVPAELFEPTVPRGYVNRPADEVHAERERAEKGEMIYATVPAGLKEEIVAAISRVEVVSFRRGADRMYVSKNAWRQDTYAGDQVTRREWWTISKQDPSHPGLDVTDKAFQLTHTVVDYARKSYRVETKGPGEWLGQPMDEVLSTIGWMDRADRFEASRMLDGKACIYVELSAKKYGTNPADMVDHMWFDPETKLPVRMEEKDGFEWDPALPADAFMPVVPEGFVQMQEGK